MKSFRPHQDSDDDELERVAGRAMDRHGIRLTLRKRAMVRSRLVKLARKNGFAGLSELVTHLEESRSPEDFLALFEVLSTNLTGFFREEEHFTSLARDLLLPMVNEGHRRLRIWSAGCSGGCEPYTIGMVLHDTLGDLDCWDAKILATDFAATELNKARRAVYEMSAVEELDSELVRRHFEGVTLEGQKYVKVREHVRKLVTYGLVNLMDQWTMQGPLDAIFCRNVMIHFDDPTRLGLVSRFKSLVRPGGLLFIGSAENLPGRHHDLEQIEASGFRKL